MISKRVTSFFRRITVCLTVSTMIVLFALSCQKDDGIKQKDPNALTKAQAKEYFEQNARTLKFFTSGLTPAGTKNLDCSLTENMIIEWEQAIEGNNEDCYYVEVPIRMATSVKAILYDAVGNLNNNIREVNIFVSLLIQKEKVTDHISCLIVSNVGRFSSLPNNSKYCVSCNKDNYSGYQIFSKENGDYYSSFVYNEGVRSNISLIPQYMISRIDSLGHDILCSGISFVYCGHMNTKGGDGGMYSGENLVCPNCNTSLTVLSDHYAFCPECSYTIGGLISSEICPICLSPYEYDNLYSNEPGRCKCCPDCHQYPCICGEGDPLCPFCWSYGCNGSCMQGNNGGGSNGGNGNNGNSGTFIHIVGAVDSLTLYGHVEQQPWGEYYNYGAQVSLMAYPNTGFRFSGWKKDGVLVSNENPLLVYAYQDMTFYAVFRDEDY